MDLGNTCILVRSQRTTFLQAVWVLIALSFLAPAVQAERGPDPYDTEPVLLEGEFKGEAIDNREKRALVILPPEKAKKYRPKDNELVAANFFHEGQFWIAKIPLDGVARVYYQKDEFSPVAAHTQLRFSFEPDREIRLYSQRKNQGRPVRAQLNDLVFSVEATMVKGDRFGLLKGMKNRFGYAPRVLSLDEAFLREVYGPGHRVEQILLDLTPTERDGILGDALRKSHEEGMRKLYHTLCASCTTEVFGLIDGNVRYRWLHRLGALLDRLPITPRLYLYARGLIPLKTLLNNPTPTLLEEFPQWMEREDFRSRWADAKERNAVEQAEFAQWEQKRRGGTAGGKCSYRNLR